MDAPVVPGARFVRPDRCGLQAERVPQGLVAFPALARDCCVPDHGVRKLRRGVPRERPLRIRRQPQRRGDQMQREHHAIPVADDLRGRCAGRDVPVAVGLAEPGQSAILVSQPDVRPESHLHRGVRERAGVPGRPPCPRKVIEVPRVLGADGNLDPQGVQVDGVGRGDFDVETDPCRRIRRAACTRRSRFGRGQALLKHDLIGSRRHLIDRFRVQEQVPTAGDRRQSHGSMQDLTACRGHRFEQGSGSEPVRPPRTRNRKRSVGTRVTRERGPGCGHPGIEPGA